MIKILVIAPYEGLANVFESVKDRYPEVSFTIQVGDLEEALEFVKKPNSQVFDAVISRGGTAQLLRQSLDIPVVEISISLYDMLRVIQLAAGYRQKYAIVGFPFITECSNALLSIQPNDQVSVHEIHDKDQADVCLRNLKNQGYSLVIGDAVIARTSKAYGMNSILVTSGQESVNSTIINAIELVRVIQKQHFSVSVLSKLWDMCGQLAVVTDLQENLIYHNIPEELFRNVFSNLSEEKVAVADGTRPVINVYHDRYKYSFSTSSLTIQDKTYLFFVAQCPIPIPVKNDQFVLCYDQLNAFVPGADTLSAQSTAGKKLQETISTVARQQVPVLVCGEAGLAKCAVVGAIHNESNLSSSPLYIIDAQRGSAQKWKNLLDGLNSPLYRTNYGICFRDIHKMDEDIWHDLIECIVSAKVHKRNRLYFTCTTGQEALSVQDNQHWADVMNKLDCFMLAIPPLRNRVEDILPVATLYVSEYNEKFGKQVVGFEDDAITMLQQYDWEMNFAQLRQVIREAMALTDGYIINTKSVQFILAQIPENAPLTYASPLLEDVIKTHILNVLQRENGNQSRAAKILGISRGTLWRRLVEYESQQTT